MAGASPQRAWPKSSYDTRSVCPPHLACTKGKACLGTTVYHKQFHYPLITPESITKYSRRTSEVSKRVEPEFLGIFVRVRLDRALKLVLVFAWK